MSPLDSWIFIAVVFAFVWAFWMLLTLSAEAFSAWWNAPVDEGADGVQPAAEEAGSLREERGY